jgi:hypothetical protein
MKSANEKNPPVLKRDDRGAVAILTLNRSAKLNALSNEPLGAMMRVLDDIELEPAVRVILITGRWTRLQCWRRHRGLSTLPGGKPGASHREIHAARPSYDAAR